MNNGFDHRNLRHSFPGAESIDRNFSQAGQDLFVLSTLEGKRNGVFLDLGCNQPIFINNTFLLESSFGWSGLSVDIDPCYFDLYVFRHSKTLMADCTRLDWDDVIDKLGTTSIDYLSIDLEPPEVTLESLRSIPFDRLDVSIITYEHDAYRSGSVVRDASRALLEKNGFSRLCSDVKVDGFEFEDWYVNPKYVDIENCLQLRASSEEWQDILFKVEATAEI